MGLVSPYRSLPRQARIKLLIWLPRKATTIHDFDRTKPARDSKPDYGNRDFLIESLTQVLAELLKVAGGRHRLQQFQKPQARRSVEITSQCLR